MLIVAVLVAGGAATRRATRQPTPGRDRAAAFTLTDENGATVRSRTSRGKAVVVTFLDAQCTDACPVVAGELARAVDDLPVDERERVVVLGISTDPKEDTPAAVESVPRPAPGGRPGEVSHRAPGG